MCMYACMHVCMRRHTYRQTYIQTNIKLRTYILTYAQTDRQTNKHTYIHTDICIHKHTNMQACKHASIQHFGSCSLCSYFCSSRHRYLGHHHRMSPALSRTSSQADIAIVISDIGHRHHYLGHHTTACMHLFYIQAGTIMRSCPSPCLSKERASHTPPLLPVIAAL